MSIGQSTIVAGSTEEKIIFADEKPFRFIDRDDLLGRSTGLLRIQAISF